MKTETKTVYVAFAGKQFDSEAACIAYERMHSGARLVGLTQADIDAAISGKNRELGDAIEAVASKVRADRLGRGDFKRKPKGAATDDAQPGNDAAAPSGTATGEDDPRAAA